MSRRGALVVGAGLVAAFALAQGWAIYGVLGAPDVFLGGVIMERLADLQTLSRGPLRWTPWRQTLLLIAGLASFAASSIALRVRLATPAADGDATYGVGPGSLGGGDRSRGTRRPVACRSVAADRAGTRRVGGGTGPGRAVAAGGRPCRHRAEASWGS